MTPEQIERYKRHFLVKEIGGHGQKKLLDAHVLIVGAGALGGVAARILAASGVGRLTIFDDDKVDVSNLQRQTQFSSRDVGDWKVAALFRGLSALNPDIRIDVVQERWAPDATLAEADLVLDGSDNFETRFALNASSLAEDVPLISGAVAGWTGQVMAVNARHEEKCPCYQCFVPAEPPDAGNCKDLGVVGALTHLVASQQALLATRYLIGETENLFGRLLLIEGLTGAFRTVKLPKDPACPACGAQ
ncbi:HesA/MoeB/ThiF family protein [Ponticaulis sp.]|uniref:HesA/MoeB/ThiF family protein n=1 Tax=Ponticaulis sp. TaxID=2020902 RepID=UPI000C555225|nr:HesA/MoeB/ThiF family protein [Ponticaulis sp.]MBN02875.1 molybdopterin biosynthesis protein MoeB [Ponticaulis sp.]